MALTAEEEEQADAEEEFEKWLEERGWVESGRLVSRAKWFDDVPKIRFGVRRSLFTRSEEQLKSEGGCICLPMQSETCPFTTIYDIPIHHLRYPCEPFVKAIEVGKRRIEAKALKKEDK